VRPMAFDVGAYYQRGDVRRALARADALGQARVSAGWFQEIAPAIEAALAPAVPRADAVVSGFLVDDFAAPFAEAARVPFALVQFAPYLPCKEHASLLLTTRALPVGLLRKLSHTLAERIVYGGRRGLVTALRQRLGLRTCASSVMARASAERTPYLGAFSPQLWPRPESYGARQYVTGALRLGHVERALLGEGAGSATLAAWLNQGPAPVLLSFGSLPMLDPPRLLAACAEHAKAHGTRFLVSVAPYVEVDERGLPDALYLLREAVDHDILLPRCAAYVHHGGAGSTHAALAAGLASWAVPLFADGPFWGSRLSALGVGGYTPYRAFDARALAHALSVMAEPAVRARARELGAHISAEDGAGTAARIVEDLVEQGKGAGLGQATHA
jgi:sterol 3beta-glucosyltransferase